MPIYAYKCESCGHAKDVLRKISDEPLTVCPQCSQPTFTKQVTAAGFQLKGSGWYVTDFRGGNTGNGAATAPKSDGDGAAAASGDSGKSADSGTTSATGTPASSATSAPAAAPAAASASKSAGGDSSSAAKTS